MALGVNIISEFNSKGIEKAIRDFKKLETRAEKTAYTLKTVDKAATNMAVSFGKMAIVGGAVAGIIGKSLVDAASNLEESQSKVNVVFGQSSDAVTDFAANAASSMGISKQAALEATGTYGNLLQAFGVAQPAAVEMSTKLVQLAGDLASFNNTSIDDAIQALRSGLSGETEPLKRFGVAINDARMKQEALNMGLYDGKGTLDTYAKTQAAYALILKDTSLAQGDYARTADGVANTQRSLAAEFANVKAELGTALLPLYKQFLGFLQDSIMPKLKEFNRLLGEEGAGAAFKYLGGEIIKGIDDLDGFGRIVFFAVGALIALKAAVIAYNITMAIFTVVNAAAEAGLLGTTIGVYALNAAMYANPVGLIVAGIVALVAILVICYMKFKWLKDIIDKVAGAIKKGWSWIKGLVGLNNDAADSADNHKKSINELVGAYEDLRMIARFKDGALRNTNISTIPPPAGGGGGGGGTIETFIEKTKKYIDALKGLKNENKAVADATKSLKDAQINLGTANGKATAALDKFNKVAFGYGKESKEAVKQARALADAQRSLTKANQTVTDATVSLSKAEKDLIKLRQKPSALKIEDGEIGVEQAKLDSEKAAFGVLEAEKELADLRTKGDATPQEIRLAEIALQEAKYSQRDAIIKVADAEAELKKLRQDTPTAEEIAAAERDVADAKLAVEEAIIAQKDATEKVNEENLLYSEIVSGAAETSDVYKEALKELNQAQKEAVDANDAVTAAYDSQREAIEKLIEAEQNLRDVKKSVGKEVVNAGNKQIGVIANKVADAVEKINIPLVTAGSGSATNVGADLTEFGLSLAEIEANLAAMDWSFGFGLPAGFMAFANGGIVTSPMLGMVGEAGPEAIIPLSELGGMGSTINLTVNAGMGADGADIGKQIIDAIRKAERRSGKVFASA